MTIKTFAQIAGYFVVFSMSVAFTFYRFTHPELTETQLIQSFSIGVLLTIAGILLIAYNPEGDSQ